MIILKSPASSVIFNDGEFFTGHGAIKMQTEISTMRPEAVRSRAEILDEWLQPDGED
jgi:hypothetical protein